VVYWYRSHYDPLDFLSVGVYSLLSPDYRLMVDGFGDNALERLGHLLQDSGLAEFNQAVGIQYQSHLYSLARYNTICNSSSLTLMAVSVYVLTKPWSAFYPLAPFSTSFDPPA